MGRGMIYWMLFGWWWEPIKFFGRVILWFSAPPVGILQSGKHEYRKGLNKRDRKQ